MSVKDIYKDFDELLNWEDDEEEDLEEDYFDELDEDDEEYEHIKKPQIDEEHGGKGLETFDKEDDNKSNFIQEQETPSKEESMPSLNTKRPSSHDQIKLSDLTQNIILEVGRVAMPIGDIEAKLAAGQMIPCKTNSNGQVQLYLQGKHIGIGQLILCKDELFVRIEDCWLSSK